MNASTPPAVAPARREAMGFSLAFPLAWADIFSYKRTVRGSIEIIM